MPRNNNSYHKAVKLRAIDMYINQHFGANTIVKELGLRNKTQVYSWVKQYQEKGESAFDEENRGKATGSHKGRPRTRFSSIEEELNYLRMENEFLKKLKALQEK